MLRCEAPAPGLQRGAIYLQAVSGNLKIGASLLVLVLVLLLLLLLVQMLLLVRRGSPTRLDAGVAGI